MHDPFPFSTIKPRPRPYLFPDTEDHNAAAGQSFVVVVATAVGEIAFATSDRTSVAPRIVNLAVKPVE